MKIKTIQFSVFISTIIIGLIVLSQLFWLRKVYLREEREFDYQVVRVLKSLYGGLDLIKDKSLNLNDLISRPAPNIYVAKVDYWRSKEAIIGLIDDRLEDFDVFTDCRIDFYDSSQKRIFYEADIHAATGSHRQSLAPANLRMKPNFNALILYFPNRNQYILSNMLFWILSAIVLLGVLIWLGASIFYLQKQRSLNKMQKDFVNNFTHEFKTPLSVIALAAESLQKPSSKNNSEKTDRYASMVEQQTRYLQNQIERLLRNAHSENSQLQLIKETVNVHQLIEDAISNLQPLIDEKKAEIILELEAENPCLIADRNYVFIVLVNLMENALKYSANPKIIIHTHNKNKHLYVSVKDNGEGIDKKNLHKIFKKFYRVNEGNIQSAKGFGIGLSFVKKILDSHHAQITVESVKGIGSIFTVTFYQNGVYGKENSGIVS